MNLNKALVQESMPLDTLLNFLSKLATNNLNIGITTLTANLRD